MLKPDVRHWISLALVALAIATAALVARVFRREPPQAPMRPPTVFQPSINCANAQFPVDHILMADNSMAGVFKTGDTVAIQRDWYRCHPVKRGEMVYLHFADNVDPVVRIVRAAAGDRIHLKRAEGKSGWTLDVNGELLTRGTEPFVFGSNADSMISLYERVHPEGLLGNDAVVFGTAPNQRGDSAELGVVNSSDFLARVLEPGAKN